MPLNNTQQDYYKPSSDPPVGGWPGCGISRRGILLTGERARETVVVSFGGVSCDKQVTYTDQNCIRVYIIIIIIIINNNNNNNNNNTYICHSLHGSAELL